MTDLRPKFWETVPLSRMTTPEWEALCDGCGKCCLQKLEYEDTGEVEYTRIACKLLDGESCRCAKYETRHQYVPDCVRLSPKTLPKIAYWLPKTCAFSPATAKSAPKCAGWWTGSTESSTGRSHAKSCSRRFTNA